MIGRSSPPTNNGINYSTHLRQTQTLFRVNCWWAPTKVNTPLNTIGLKELCNTWTAWKVLSTNFVRKINLPRIPLMTKKRSFSLTNKQKLFITCLFFYTHSNALQPPPPLLHVHPIPRPPPHFHPPLPPPPHPFPHRPSNATRSIARCWSGASAKQLSNSALKAAQTQCASVCVC